MPEAMWGTAGYVSMSISGDNSRCRRQDPRPQLSLPCSGRLAFSKIKMRAGDLVVLVGELGAVEEEGTKQDPPLAGDAAEESVVKKEEPQLVVAT